MRVDQVILNEKKTLQTIVQALRGRLSLDDNLQCTIITVADTGPAATSFTVEHKLGKIPTAYIANIDKPGNISSVTKGSWTTTNMQLQCSAANAGLTLIVF